MFHTLGGSRGQSRPAGCTSFGYARLCSSRKGRAGSSAGCGRAKAKRQRLPDRVWKMQAKEQTATSTASRPGGRNFALFSGLG